MQQAQETPGQPSSTPASRRALREAQRPRGPRRARPAASRWVPRSAILLSLAAATIAVPLAGAGAVPDVAVDAKSVEIPVGPSALEVLSASPVDQQPPTSLLAAGPAAERVTQAASRSSARDPLPGCDGEARSPGENGQIATSDLCRLWDGENMLRGDAAVTLTELNGGFSAAFGRDLCITDSYRTLAVQRTLARTKPGLAARPGSSNHGWGLAIDLCASETSNRSVLSWLEENGALFGWENPAWAQPGGSGAFEPWHWEYVPGTIERGSNW